MLADLVEIAPALETGGVGIDQHQRNPLRALVRIGLGDHDHAIGVLAVGDVGFGAVDDEVVAVLFRRGADALKVGACARFGHRDRGDDVAGDHAGEVFGALFGCAEPFEIIGGDVRLQGEARRRAEVGQLLGDDAVEPEIEAEAAVFLLHRGAQQARLTHRLPHLARDDALFLMLVEIGGEVFGKDLADRVAEGFVIGIVGGAIGGREHGGSLRAKRF